MSGLFFLVLAVLAEASLSAQPDLRAAWIRAGDFGRPVSVVAGIGAAPSAALPPENDNFADRAALTGNSVALAATTLDATAEAGEPAHAGTAASKTLWWRWTAPQTGRVQVDTFGSSFDTVLAVYAGDTLASLRPVAFNDEAGPGYVSALSFIAMAGSTYAIVAGGWDGAAGALQLQLGAGSSLELYGTDFESFALGPNTIAGTDGWLASHFTGGVTGTTAASFLGSRAAYIGLNATSGSGASIGRPIGYNALAGGTSKLQFDVDLAVVDSTNGRRDDFVFIFYNTQGELLGAIDFYNPDGRVYRFDGTSFHQHGAFQRDVKLQLSVTLDLAANLWFATLNGVPIFGTSTINAQGKSLSLGMIACAWAVVTIGAPGNNYLALDNFRIAVVPAPPQVLVQPVSRNLLVGQSALFSSAAGGIPAPTYQWQASPDGVVWEPLPESAIFSGVTTPTLSANNANLAMAGLRLRLRATNGNSPDAFSTPAVLGVATSPQIDRHLRTQRAVTGEAVTFAVSASGTGALSYRWQHNGADLPGATAASLTVSGVTLDSQGWYRVTVTDAHGSATSVARLDVAVTDGIVAAWGNNLYGESAVPLGLIGIRAVAAGDTHSLALLSDGTVAAWGSNQSGESSVPAGLAQVVAIAAGDRQSVALKEDGTVIVWGTPWGPEKDQYLAKAAALTDVVAVRPGWALRANGTVAGWSSSSLVPPEVHDLVAIGGGASYLGLKSDRTALSWGFGYATQAIPVDATDVVALAGAVNLSMLVRAGGTLGAWGRPAETRSVPTDGDYRAVAPGFRFGLGLKRDGRVISWGGFNGLGPVPDYVTTGVAVAVGPNHALVLMPAIPPKIQIPPENDAFQPDGMIEVTATVSGVPPLVYRWKKGGVPLADDARISGAGSSRLTISGARLSDTGSYLLEVSGPGGVTTTVPVTITVAAPPVITTRPLSRIVTQGQPAVFSIVPADGAGLSYEWRRNGVAVAGATTASLALSAATASDRGFYEVVVRNSAGGLARSVFMVDVVPLHFDRTGVVTWGGVQPPAELLDVVGISTNGFGLAVKADGTVAAWDPGNWTGVATVPADLRDVVAVSAGDGYCMALKADGTVATWGSGVPPNAPRLTRVVGLAAVHNQSAAVLRSDGAIQEWGSSVPAPPRETGFAAISIGDGGAGVAQRADGTFVVFGSNSSGQRNVPAGLTAVTRIAAGGQHFVALRPDGSVSAWGFNATGQSTVPDGLGGIWSVAAGDAHSVALRADGTLIGWGYNADGRFPANGTSAGVLAVVADNPSTTAIVALIKPSILEPPAARLIAPGGIGTLSVRAGGTGPFTYRWQKNDADLPGATDAVLSLGNVAASDAGSYRVIVANRIGTVVSPAATVRVGAVPAIVTAPLAQVLAPGSPLSLTVVAEGSGPLSYQWQRDGADIAGATTATFAVAAVQATHAGRYGVVVGNPFGLTATAAVVVQIRPAASPAIDAQPRNQVASVGSGAVFRVTGDGVPAPTYQWFKNTVAIPGATTDRLVLAAVAAGDAGSYSVVLTNAAGAVTSTAAVLTVLPAGLGATHAVLGGGYRDGVSTTVTNRFHYAGGAPALTWQVVLPAGWTLAASSGDAGAAARPATGARDLLEWSWSAAPASPVVFGYTLTAPGGETAAREIAALVAARPVDGNIQFLAHPDPLVLARLTTHAADTNRDFRISLSELTRVIELYNARSGTVRNGLYRADPDGEDGFASDAARATEGVPALAAFHSADTDRNGKIDLAELTRVIALFNHRAGAVRTGQYRVRSGSEDGFDPGP